MRDTSASGNAAEDLAACHLQRQGLTLLERNYRCRFGEIDLVMRDAATLVFVEVRMRRGSDYGGAAASITSAKQAKLIKAAQHYLAQSGKNWACRFDAVLLTSLKSETSIEWIKSAFSAD